MKAFLFLLIYSAMLFAQPDEPNVNTFNFDFNEKSFKKSKGQIEIKMVYPVTKYKALDRNIDTLIRFIKKEIISDLEWVEIDLNYKTYSHKQFVIIQFDLFAFTGGAHPNQYSFIYTYDTTKKKCINLNDLFTDKKYLTKIASYCKEKLTNHFKANDMEIVDWFNDGLAPVKENYSLFLISERGIYFFFGQYQIAPYAAGAFCVLVPKEYIAGMINY